MRPGLVVVWITVTGCGDNLAAPDPDPVVPYTLADLAPQRIGDHWRYRDIKKSGAVSMLDKAIVGCREVMFFNCAAGETQSYYAAVQQTPDVDPGDLDESYLTETSSANLERVFELRSDTESDSYWPPFVRVLGPPYVIGRVEQFDFIRCKYDGAAGTTKVSDETYRYEVFGMNVVDTPAGTYDALGIRSTDLNGETKNHWYAPGVGKVLEEQLAADGTVVSSEALISFTPGTGESCR